MPEFVTRHELEKANQNVLKMFDQHKLIVSQHKWRATLSAMQNDIPSATFTKILLDQLTFDCAGIGFSSNGYTVQERGKYLVYASCHWVNPVTDKRYYAVINVNGSSFSYADTHSSHTGMLSSTCFDIVPLNVGDVVYLYCYHDAGAATPDIYGHLTIGRYVTYLDVHLLSRRCM